MDVIVVIVKSGYTQI